jgi:hypothetical protein
MDFDVIEIAGVSFVSLRAPNPALGDGARL